VEEDFVAFWGSGFVCDGEFLENATVAGSRRGVVEVND